MGGNGPDGSHASMMLICLPLFPQEHYKECQHLITCDKCQKRVNKDEVENINYAWLAL